MDRKQLASILVILTHAIAVVGCAGPSLSPLRSGASLAPHASDNQLLASDTGFHLRSENASDPLTSLGEKVKSFVEAIPTAPADDTIASGRSLPRTDMKTSKFAQARLLERQGEIDQAEGIYRQLLNVYPDDVPCMHRLGIIAGKQGKMAEAESFLREALQRSPANPQLLSDLGYIYYLQTRLDEAESLLREAVAHDPHHEMANNNLGVVLGEQRRYAESLETFKKVGSDAEAYANLAYVFAQQGDLERSKSGYLHALKLDNTLKPAANAVLQIVERQGLAAESELRRETDSTPVETGLTELGELSEVSQPRADSGRAASYPVVPASHEAK